MRSKTKEEPVIDFHALNEDGAKEGSFVGLRLLGFTVGKYVRRTVGFLDGFRVGFNVFLDDGLLDGENEGKLVRLIVGFEDGRFVGFFEGLADGLFEGDDGLEDNVIFGAWDGETV